MGPTALTRNLQATLPDARLQITRLPETDIRLWLLDPTNLERGFSSEETRRILHQPPYWAFCWASGLALAQWLQEAPHWVRGQRVLDLGCGSGVAAIAAARAGARSVLAVDADPQARSATRINAALNRVETRIAVAAQLPTAASFDTLLLADVFYDPDNLPLLEQLPAPGRQILIADSRLKQLPHAGYPLVGQRRASTCPDLGEAEIHHQVRLYRGRF